MKRGASPEGDNKLKKRRKSAKEIFEDPSSAVSSASLLKNYKVVDNDKFVQGKVNRVWPAETGKLSFELVKPYIRDGHEYTARLNVCLSGKCVRHFDDLDIKPQDDLYLALKGVKIQKASEHQLNLSFHEGVMLKRARKPFAREVTVDTWKSLGFNAIDEDGWFSTPEDRASVHSPGTLIRGQQPVKPSRVEKSSSEKADSSNANQGHLDKAVHEKPPEMSKKAFKKLKKAQNAQFRSAANQETADSGAGRDEIRGDDINLHSTDEQSKNNRTLTAAPLSTSSGRPTNANSVKQLDLPQGSQENIRTLQLPPRFKLLDNLTPSTHPVHIIGVVTSITPPSKTRTGEWMCCVRLGDTSNITVDNISRSTEGFSVNCFAKRYLQWLPCPKPGDVLILCNVKVVNYHGNISGIGYHNKMRWAIFLPEKGELYHGELGDTPKEEGLADGEGYIFSPFYQANASEIKYSLKLSDWWRGVLKSRSEALGEVQQIGGGALQVTNLQTKGGSREHRLIGETMPDTHPHGYFDCTVEFLHGWAHDNGVYSAYVTDYTRNNQTQPCYAQWCPPSLHEFVFQIEMWDKAAEVGSTMKEGEYYYIQNARMMLRPSGYVEGKVVQNKIRHLYEHEADADPRLEALLNRKKTWMDANNGATSAFEHQLIQDVTENKFFNCTVEILHAVPVQQERTTEIPSFIYVTDYTRHPDLPSLSRDFRGKIPWSDSLEDHVVKVALWGKQAGMADQVSIGSYYLIKKMRLKYNSTGHEFRGSIGGAEKLIQKLNPRNTENPELQRLLQRKENWIKLPSKANSCVERERPSLPNAKAPGKEDKRLLGRHYNDIKDIMTCSVSPNKFRILGRPIDFYPRSLRNALIAHCRKCENDIPESQKACYNCTDFEHEYVEYRYQLFVLFQDEAGDHLKLSISDNCKLFEGLKRADIREDAAAYKEFYNRIKPLVGQVSEFREGSISIDQIPFFSLIINHWMTSTGQRAYNLEEFEGAV